ETQGEEGRSGLAPYRARGRSFRAASCWATAQEGSTAMKRLLIGAAVAFALLLPIQAEASTAPWWTQSTNQCRPHAPWWLRAQPCAALHAPTRASWFVATPGIVAVPTIP